MVFPNAFTATHSFINPKLFLDRNFTVGCWFAATGTLYAATGLALMLAIVLHWRGDLWHLHAPANAKKKLRFSISIELCV
jgi:hypothetical protein